MAVIDPLGRVVGRRSTPPIQKDGGQNGRPTILRSFGWTFEWKLALRLFPLLFLFAAAALAAPEPFKPDGNTLALLRLNETSGETVTNVASHGRIGHWRLDGTVSRGASSVAPAFGTAYGPFREGGASARVEGRREADEVGGDRRPYTVEAWVKWAGEGTLRRRQVLVGSGLVAVDQRMTYGWMLTFTPILKSPTVEIGLAYVGGGKGAAAKTPELEWDEDLWHHVAVSVSPLPDDPKTSVFRFYVTPAPKADQGAHLVATVTNHSVYIPTKAAPGVSGAVFYLGGTNWAWHGVAPFLGLVDEVRISDVARTSFFGLPAK
jgi:hypothetical protein